MRTPIAATLAALTLAAALSACTADEPTPEALPDETVPSATATPSPAVEDTADEAEALYAEFGATYPGDAVVEEVSLGLCGQFPDPGPGTAFRELVTYGGYEPTDAAAAMITAAAVYCPDQRDAVDEWAAAAGGVDDWSEDTADQ